MLRSSIDWSRVHVSPSSEGQWVAIEPHLGLVATGGNEGEARRNLGLKAEGKTPPNERPILRLCRACSEAHAEAGARAHLEGIMVCASCAAAIDTYEKDVAKWERKKARNRRKKKKRGPKKRLG